MTETYDEDDRDAIAALLIGRRIVAAETGPDVAADWNTRTPYGDRHEGRLVLDDGTVLYLAGHVGGCSCGAGDYPLARVAAFDNAITGVEVEARPAGDGYGGPYEGVYRIFVYADTVGASVAEFVGSDGNGYYGTGFSVTVQRAPAASGPRIIDYNQETAR